MQAPSNRAALFGALLVTCALTGASLTGCGKSQPSSAPQQNQPKPGTKIHAYTVRGEVTALPADGTDLTIHHESIPEFVGPEGKLGMNAMVMPFWPPVGVSLDDARIKSLDLTGIAVGDKVSFTFEVVQDEATGAPKGYYATKVEKLPADTKLDFSPLPPPAPSQEAHEGAHDEHAGDGH